MAIEIGNGWTKFDTSKMLQKPGRGGRKGSSVCQIQVDAHSDPGSNPA